MVIGVLCGQPLQAAASDSVPVVRVNVSTRGEQANAGSNCGDISADGRYVEFRSGGDNLVRGDTNHFDDVFVRDVESGTTVRVNVSSSGEQANDQTISASISGDGRFVVFESYASNLTPDSSYWGNIYIHNLATGGTGSVDRSLSGEQANGPSWSPSISSRGRYVSFASAATNLDPRATDRDVSQIYLRDRRAAATALVSVAPDGAAGNGNSYSSSVSRDGRFVAFESAASNLVRHDTNGVHDVFVRDLWNETTRRVSVSSDGRQGNAHSLTPRISDDGRYVAYSSLASNLVADDTNGQYDGFVRDVVGRRTIRVSVSSSGAEGSGVVTAISPDGRFVGVYSESTNLVRHDTNGVGDAFIYDLRTRTMRRVSLSSSGRQANGSSGTCAISYRGVYAVVDSSATNLVPDDTNAEPDVFRVGPLRP